MERTERERGRKGAEREMGERERGGRGRKSRKTDGNN